MIPAPCKRNCCLNQADVCMGCGRTLSEITGWHQASAEQKQQILLRSAERMLQQPALPLFQASRGKPS
ncbi:DUF1289 domain-containing protein [Rheinheimera sp.]|uniref:DUF1289 domain-containing protein n=1 Tax=Rheinheimera sp. TaxID=1869214 RepID=UPI0027B905B6|nr:DUF1289 domain-containing protein [Rheinheimera sp.]